jgi:post-segregation antitoxin (ccd killing protein)
MAKISVTVDEELLAEARRLAPGGNLSGLVNEALELRVKLGRAREFLEQEKRELGPLPADLRERVRAQWPQ